MGRPKLAADSEQLSFTADAQKVEILDLIARASKIGVPSRGAMLRVALDEFIESRMRDEEVRGFVEASVHSSKNRLQVVRGETGSAT